MGLSLFPLHPSSSPQEEEEDEEAIRVLGVLKSRWLARERMNEYSTMANGVSADVVTHHVARGRERETAQTRRHDTYGIL